MTHPFTITIPPLDQDTMVLARTRQQQLTKPPGSMGRLEDIAIQIAGITHQVLPVIQRKAVIIMAADHGVTVEGVSAYPSAVTPQMVHNFLYGGAAINALARQAGAEVVVVDIGVAESMQHPNLLSHKVAFGTANMTQGSAMTQEQVHAAIMIGMNVATSLIQQGVDLLATGDMGIGNTTASSAITAVLAHVPVQLVTGRGTGIDDAQLAHKIATIERAIAHNQPDATDPLDVLAKVGGLEIAGLVGVMLASAMHRVPIVIDGFISGAAALVATRLVPAVCDYLLAGHVSVERGHHIILEQLKLAPILDLNLRLGEGTGAVLAMTIIDAALCVHRDMATFAESGVSDKIES
ncbi:MAG: nicotinate-nucleotide--dimethylbenzimidazole phosphoribosyltransferase [Ktedonobacteraceae bacterium]